MTLTRPAIPVRSAMPRPPRRSPVAGLVVLVAVLAVVAVAGLAVGSNPIGLATTWRVLWHPDGSQASVIVHDLRLPRTLLGVLVGAALGAAGALMQGHTRNPLADPGLFGVTAGAAFAVVLGIAVLGLGTPASYTWLALLGAAIASVAVFAIGSSGGRGPHPLSLVLAGAAVSALLDSVSSAFVLGDQDALDGYRSWVVGSLSERGWGVLDDVTPFLLVGLLLACAHAPALNVLSLGDDVARALGQHVGRTRLVGLLAVMLLTGAATAACGPIGFVGLVVPHVARVWTGPDHRWLVPYAAVLGGVLLLAADVLGRVVARPGELQVGIVLAVVGAPFFIALVRRRRLVSV